MPNSPEINPTVTPAPPGEALVEPPVVTATETSPEAAVLPLDTNTEVGAETATASAVEPVVASTSGAPQPNAFNFDSGEEERTSPAEIDARRARHSLDRARQHAERGELAAAILASRQAIALSPQLAEAHSLLGNYLEKNGDRAGAITAYEKALALAPNSLEEQIRLENLKAEPTGVYGDTFSFDEAGQSSAVGALPIGARLPPSLLDEEESETPASEISEQETPAETVNAAAPLAGAGVVAASVVAAQPAVAPAKPVAPAAPITEPETLYNFSPLPTTGVATLNPEPGFLLPPIESPRQRESVAAFAPGMPTYSVGSGPSTSSAPATSPVNFGFNPNQKTPAPAWSRFLRGPSLYNRTLPIAAVTVLGLGLMVWALGRSGTPTDTTPAVAATDPIETVSTNPNQPVPQQPVPSQSVPPQLTTSGSNPNGQGFTISNQPSTATVPSTGAVPVNAAGQAASAPAGSSGAPRLAADASRPAAGTAPRFPQANLLPAAVPPASPRSSSTGSGRGSNLILPRPDVAAPAPPDPPTQVLPPDNSIPNVGGSGLNPAGSPDRGYIRVRNARVGTSLLPERADASGRNDEQAANDAARNGETDTAIARLSTAISSNPNDGYRYQQRAGLFMQSGDYGRAADDFQAAISAYQNQIDRGDQVASARAGLRSARSGLNVALSRR